MAFTAEKQKITPLFLSKNSKMIGQENIMELCGENGSNFAFRNYNQLLAEMIPARTIAMGKASISKIGPINFKNFDLTSDDFRNDWPQERTKDSDKGKKWLHSDAREVAYLYTYKLFDKWVNLGHLDEDKK